MRVVVISDTHMPRSGRTFPTELVSALGEADLVLHLGDVTQESVLDELRQWAPVRAVHGNNDSPELRRRLPLEERFDLAGHSVAMLHGHVGGRTAREAAMTLSDTEVVLFGHSHRASNARIGPTLYLNPGSPTDPRWSGTRSFAVLDITTTVDAVIVPITIP